MQMVYSFYTDDGGFARYLDKRFKFSIDQFKNTKLERNLRKLKAKILVLACTILFPIVFSLVT